MPSPDQAFYGSLRHGPSNSQRPWFQQTCFQIQGRLSYPRRDMGREVLCQRYQKQPWNVPKPCKAQPRQHRVKVKDGTFYNLEWTTNEGRRIFTRASRLRSRLAESGKLLHHELPEEPQDSCSSTLARMTPPRLLLSPLPNLCRPHRGRSQIWRSRIEPDEEMVMDVSQAAPLREVGGGVVTVGDADEVMDVDGSVGGKRKRYSKFPHLLDTVMFPFLVFVFVKDAQSAIKQPFTHSTLLHSCILGTHCLIIHTSQCGSFSYLQLLFLPSCCCSVCISCSYIHVPCSTFLFTFFLVYRTRRLPFPLF